ncbi:hypothetical protein JDM601_1267 [Mycolicibacter sinensis]|uniref:Uncharacterized protein n=1 Tax=Mycolicibacter sinensis (strain JDM601) TaxID=875328 RepID=F5YWI0_MYCSD|nr:hypothetical protein JDM601_1267 [Mycolicibacter sinensis]
MLIDAFDKLADGQGMFSQHGSQILQADWSIAQFPWRAQ